MEKDFLRKYYFVRKTTSVQKAICEFTQGATKTFHEARERLRDLTQECLHHGVSNNELTQIFYDRLGPQGRYLLDASSGGTFMRKYKDNTVELMKTVVENRHHNAAKQFRLINAKSTEMGMLLERIKKWRKFRISYWIDSTSTTIMKDSVRVSLQEALACVNCSRFDHVELDFPVMVIQGQDIYRKAPSRGTTQQGQQNYSGSCPNYYNNPIFNNNHSQHAEFRRNNDQTYPPSYNGKQQPYANQRQSMYIPQLQPQAYTQAPRLWKRH